MLTLEPFDFFVLRTPLLSLEAGLSLIGDEDRLKDVLSGETSPDDTVKLVRTAIINSSPEFYERSLGKFDRKTKNTLIRYIVRMSARPTPFGLYAGYSMGRLGAVTRTEFSSSDSWSVHFKPDGDIVLRSLVDEVQRGKSLLYKSPNLFIDKNIMSISSRSLNEDLSTKEIKKITIKINSAGEEVLGRINKKKFTIASLYEGRNTEEKSYLRILHQNKIIAPAIGYESYLGDKSWSRLSLGEVQSGVGRIQKNSNIVLRKKTETCSINKQTFDLVARAIETLHKLFSVQIWVSNKKNREIGQFCISMEKKFPDSELPLIKALDPLYGVSDSLHPETSGTEPLFTSSDLVEKYFQKKIFASNERIEEWELTKSDVDELQRLDRYKMYRFSKIPSSVSAHIELLKNGRVNLKSIVGIPSIRPLTRFAAGDDELSAELEKITNWDKVKNPDVIFAEIIDWPVKENVANFTTRRITTEYIIPLDYLHSHWDLEKQILLEDLMVSVNYGRVRLRSKKFNKEVVPVLSASYNLINESNPFLSFLAQVATQDNFANQGWIWGKLRKLPYVPRVRMGNIIFSARQWRFTEDDIETLIRAKDKMGDFRSLCVSYGIPQRFYWNMHTDLRLYVDLTNDQLISSCLDLLKTKFSITESYIEEFFETDQIHDAIIPFKNLTPPKQDPFVQLTTGTEIAQNIFHVGEECIFLKLYTNTAAFDELLTQDLKAFLQSIQKQNLLKYWFFIKYMDPSPHIRLRLFLKDKSTWSIVLPKITGLQKKLFSENKIWNFQLETFKRDFDGHQLDKWKSFDQYSHIDSERILRLNSLRPYHSLSNDEKLLYKVMLVHTIVDLYFPDSEKRIESIHSLRRAYETMGFPASEEQKQSFNAFWRENRKVILDFIKSGAADVFEEHFKEYKNELMKIKAPKNRVISLQRWVHLALNRTHSAITYSAEDQIYNLLYKAYLELAHS